jgi:putative two-component system response regulator
VNQRVLIVDDTEINLQLLAALVKRLPHTEAHSFTDPVLALEFVRHTPVDMAVVDFMMPSMNGLEFMGQFRQIAGTLIVPVLMVTANEERAVRYQALELGADDFLAKPVDPVEFLARAKNLLKLSDATRKLTDQAAWLAESVRIATQEVRERERETVMCLAKAAEHRDADTGMHILRMSHYARLIARQLGLPEADQELLLDAAAMHDIGKVGIPDRILLKPGNLDPDELSTMRQHALIGYDLLKGSTSPLLQAGAAIALGHHEKYDGSGYPQGLKGEDIPIFSRIVAVADVFDALSSARPYKRAWSLAEAANQLRAGRGGHFDPRCVDAFLEAWPEVLEISAKYKDPEVPPDLSSLAALAT